ncbi:unnamed protein product [Clavelina lepadiformis]|uniref:Aryl hydrocarbon receptor n=1 Tax=Clavelina lepadiformis TaxID=159417 RepID=A0ABP0F1B5_CLALP
MSATMQVGGAGAQYANRKRRRPQAKKNKDAEKENAQSNPSKRHRDRLNIELDNVAKLIPFPDEVLNKLDKLSILRLAVAYLRNKNYHASETGGGNEIENEYGQLMQNQHKELTCFKESESKLALQALHGFLIVVTQDYNIFYVTETIQDYLGFPQCDIMNLSMLDLIHAEDREIFRRNMQIHPQYTPPDAPQEGDPPTMPEYAKIGMDQDMFRQLAQDGLLHRSFICRLRCLLDNSSGFLALHFTGHLRIVRGQNKKNEAKVPLPPETAMFLLASPLQSPSILEIRTKNLIFRTKHKLDYTPLGIDARGRSVLGYTEEQLRQRSGYEFVHSADMMHCADAHTKLMRKGESGLTVFRLLHKNNNWVWVTASARIVLRNGRPEYIIATQRPILDQEGEEHMKKRANAFRFDFTGQAVLYGEVNPIGTKGGPENNPLNESEPASKRIRMSNNEAVHEEQLDRSTLYGAQSMQRLDIYIGSMPNHPTNIYANSGITASAAAVDELLGNDQIISDTGPLTNESDIHFYPLGTDNAVNQTANLGQNFQDNDGASAFQNMSGLDMARMNSGQQYQVNNITMAQASQPCMDNSPTGYREGNQMKQEPPRLYHPPADGNPFPNQPTNQQTQRQTSWKQQQPMTVSPSMGKHMPKISPSVGKQMPMSNSSHMKNTVHGQTTVNPGLTKSENIMFQNQEVFPEYNPNYQMTQGVPLNQRTVQTLQFGKQHPNASAASREASDALRHQQHVDSNGFMEPMQQYGNNRNYQQPSVIHSLTIKSMITDKKTMNTIPTVTSGNPNVQNYPINKQPDNDWNKVEFVGCQDNSIQFDLNKIATDYQTTDPMSKVEDYLKDHPAEALAIASGVLPQENMPKLSTDKVQAYMMRCQFPQQQHPMNNSHQAQFMNAGMPQNTGKNIMNQSFMTQQQQQQYMENSNQVSPMSTGHASDKLMSVSSFTDSDRPITGNFFQGSG